ncbi:hypothetical protein P7K49_029628 [Saguinus oedipus]|uniref:Uncharacterized protein n=1 Tax=Saguinus oedipus TaxID=9490 RepID=A0ABQ9U8I6_SAGOE|nr:hypothetical protein P7K49_029628 [Saguinus oedipus]
MRMLGHWAASRYTMWLQTQGEVAEGSIPICNQDHKQGKGRGAEFCRPGCSEEEERESTEAHWAFGDHRDGVISARTYFYANEAKCDSHMETLLHCIEASGAASDDGFLAIKLTLL